MKELEHLVAILTSAVKVYDGPVKDGAQLFIHDFHAEVVAGKFIVGKGPIVIQLSSLDVRVNYVHSQKLHDLVNAQSLESGSKVCLYPYYMSYKSTPFIHAGAISVVENGEDRFFPSRYLKVK